MSTSTLWVALTTQLGYSLQAVTYRAAQRDELERRMYMERVKSFVTDPSMAIFLDECHKGAKESRRRRHWSLRGYQPVALELWKGENKSRYCMIVAADINGFIINSSDVIHAKRGNNDTDETRGTVNTARFEPWVEHSLVPHLGRFLYGEPRSVVILDSASIHHSPRIVQLIQATGAVVLYLPPYSPDFNPIELFFREYKTSLRRDLGSFNDDDTWFSAHFKALCSVTPAMARNFFRHCKVPGCEVIRLEEEEEENMVLGAVAAHISFIQGVVCSVVAAKKRSLFVSLLSSLLLSSLLLLSSISTLSSWLLFTEKSATVSLFPISFSSSSSSLLSNKLSSR